MRYRAFLSVSLASVLLAGPAEIVLGQAAQSAATRDAPAQPIPRDVFDRWFREVSNTGRWGRDDSIGTLNFITPAIRAAAARGVRHGITVSLARPLATGPNNNAIFALEELATVAARRNQRTFLFIAAPLPLQRGSGSLVNALAVF